MKNAILRQAFRQARFSLRTCVRVILSVLLLSAVSHAAATSIKTLAGGPNAYAGETNYYGSTNSVFGTLYSQFDTPSAIALNSSGTYLYVADRDNNEIRELDLLGGYTYTFTTNLIKRPVGVAVDGSGNVFVLNQGSTNAAGVATNGSVLEFDTYGDLVSTNSGTILLTNAAGMALDVLDNIYVTLNGNTLIKIAAGTTNITTIATISTAGTYLQGVVVKRSGTTAGFIAVSDSGRNGIYLVNPSNGQVTTNAGFNGVGDGTGINNSGVLNSNAKFSQPSGIAEAGDGSLIVADLGNNRVKVVTTSGITTNLYGVASNYWSSSFPGWLDGTVTLPEATNGVAARLPFGIALAPDGSIYSTEDYYHIIRHVTGAGFLPPPPPPPAAPTGLAAVTNYGQVNLTWNASQNATSYNVERSTSSGGPYTTITTTSGTTYSDTSVINGTTYYYVIAAVNTGGTSPLSSEISATPPFPPVSDPQIGYVDFPATSSPIPYTSVFHPVSTATFNNNVYIVIEGTAGTQTFYTYTNALASANSVTNPASLTGSAPAGYQDGLSQSQVALNYAVATILPSVTVWAVGEQTSHPNSAIVSAQFQFVVGNPSITGNNAAQFTVNDITSGAQFLYTADGSDPRTNSNAVLIGPASSTNGITLSLQFPPNTNSLLFQIVGIKANYQTSSVVSQVFSTTNFVANTISFGFASGEASSDFVASPGQTFYAPVTMSTLSGTVIDSLQFNLTITNAGPNPGPPIAPNGLTFTSMLMKPAPQLGANIYTPIPPYMFASYVTNGVSANQIINYEGTNFVSLEVVNTNNGIDLLGVGWLERAGQTNLYNTLSQDLIAYSLAHDDLFPNSSEPNEVIVGGYSFQVPVTATNGQTYQIQIGRPSATTDGIGEPGSAVSVFAPTNGSLVGGAINSIKNVTVGQRQYIVGDVYPFRWFNAGDFGETNLVNADVQQVFQSAVYGLNSPPYDVFSFNGVGYTNVSDFFDAMDSCGNIGTFDNDPADLNYGYYTNNYSVLTTTNLFNGNDTSINQIAFGDGNLDVCDVYVTYRRSLDPSLTWFSRFWANGVRVAVTNNINQSLGQTPSPAVLSKAQPAASPIFNSVTNQPKVNFTAGDFQGSAGQTVQIPITAQIFGNYPLRVLMLNLTVVPLDGSPALTTPVQFTPNSVLGQPTITDSQGNGNYAATWLNSAIGGLTNTASIGTLTVTIPAGANGLSSYAIHFDHASGSPNGIASFPKQTLTGLITLSSRTNSTYNDGIPDSWRLRYFGTIYNVLSVSNACPSGDGFNNWQKFVAGVDPTVANDFPSTNPVKPLPSGSTSSIHWPTVSGVQYVIQRSGSLFPGSWSNITTNTGTGTDMEFDDTSTGSAKFYRVLIMH